ncbi:MAG: hypothetical protein ABDH49_03745 [Candidatus Hydrothermales bacterium]
MKILNFLLILLLKEDPIYISSSSDLYAGWDSIYFYVDLKISKFDKVYFAIGTGNEGLYFFPELESSSKFPVKLKHFFSYDIKSDKVLYSNKGITFHTDTIGREILINFKVPKNILENSKHIYFWIGFELNGIFCSMPEQRGDIYPVFLVPLDQDCDGVWDRGIDLKAVLRIIYKEEEEELEVKEYKKFFSPENENLEIILECGEKVQTIFASVYSLAGKKVKDLDIIRSNNKIKIIWDGRDYSGKIEKAGVYLIVIKSGDKVWAKIPVVLFR